MTIKDCGQYMKKADNVFDEFLEKHKPIQNLIDENAGFDGMMFETYGKELDFVRE